MSKWLYDKLYDKMKIFIFVYHVLLYAPFSVNILVQNKKFLDKYMIVVIGAEIIFIYVMHLLDVEHEKMIKYKQKDVVKIMDWTKHSW